MALILKQESNVAVTTPPAGSGSIFLNGSNQVSVKDSTGNVSSIPTFTATGNTQVFYNDAGGLGLSANMTFDETTNTFSVTTANVNSLNFGSGSITGTGNITTGNIIGTIAAGSNTIITTGNANVGNLGFGSGVITGTGNITGGNIIGIIAAGSNSITTSGNLTTGNANLGNLASANYVNVNNILTVTGNANTGNLGTTTAVITTGNITTINSGLMKNGLSNLTIAAGGNISTFINGNTTPQLQVNSGGANIAGNLTTGNANLGNLASANYFTGTLTTASQPNITSVGTLTSLDVGSTVTAVAFTANTGVFTGNGNGLSSIVGANVTGAVAYATTANAVAGANVTGDVSGANHANIADSANSVAGGNVTGTVANATYSVSAGTAGTVTTNAQPNITSVGTLTSLSVTGNITNGNVTGGNLVSASYLAGTLTTAAQPNITSVGTLTSLGVSGTITAANITANTGVFTGNGNGLSSLVGANVTGQVGNALVAGTIYTNAQPNITSVGTLSSLAVTANANVGNLFSAAAVQGTTLTSNIATGTAPLTVTSTTRVSNLNVAYANVADFINVTTQSSGNAYLMFANALTGNVTETANATFIANTSNGALYATTFVGALSGAATSATTAGTVTTAAQPNITSVGTLTSLGVNGTVTAVAFTANTGVFTGNGNGLSSLVGANVTGQVTYAGTANSVAGANVSGAVAFATTANSVAGANVSGQVGNALVAGTVYTAAQSNITSVGTLTSLGVSGTVTAANITANTGVFTGNGNGLSSLVGANVTGQVGNALVAGTVYTNAQPNITSVGTLTGLTLSGNVNMGTKNITSLAEPVASTDAATKNYVDTVAQGLHVHQAAYVATTGTLATATGGTVTYNNGTSGVGATLTTTGTYLLIDGGNVQTVGTRILVKNEANAAWNGVYTYTSTTVITRATDFDNSIEVAGGDFLFVTSGTTQADTSWVQTTDAPITIGTSLLVFAQFSGAGTYQAGTGLTLTGSVFSVNASQTQVTSVGTLTSLGVSGTVTAVAFTANTGVFTGNGNGLSSLVGANVTGTVSSATTAGTVTTAAQGNITSVGTLTSLNVSGTITAPNFTANTGVFTGNGNGLSSLVGANVTGTVPFANVATYDSITQLLAGNAYLQFANALTGTAIAYANAAFVANTSNGALYATTFIGALSGAATSATTAGTVTTNAQPNITSTGTLTGLTIGNATANAVFGNGTIVLNSGLITGNGNGLSSLVGANVTGAVSFATTANAVAGANVSGTVASATTAGTVTTNAQPNITSTGTLTSLSVTGNITAGNINAGNLLTANYSTAVITTNAQPNITSVGTLTSLSVNGTATAVAFTANTGVFTGNGFGLSTIVGGNVTGAVASATSATTAGTVTTAAQPNITSVGTLTSLSVTGNISGSNIIATTNHIFSVATGISAAGTVQANATAVTKDFNVVSTVASGSGITLPTAVAGMRITVVNTSANALAVYPLGNGIINTQAANVAYSQLAGARLDFICTAAATAPGGQWYTLNATYA